MKWSFLFVLISTQAAVWLWATSLKITQGECHCSHRVPVESMAIVIGGAEMLATRKSNSSGPFPDKLRNPSVRFGGVSSDLFAHAIHKNYGNGHDSSRGRQ